MVIRFTSTLTADDESRVATALLKAVAHLLAPFQISYSIRIETTAGDVVEDGRPGMRSDPWTSGAPRERRALADGHPFAPLDRARLTPERDPDAAA
jgi:hypothetical protein